VIFFKGDEAQMDLMTLIGGIPAAERLSGEETLAVQVKLWRLLAKHSERYTIGDSSSIPLETAQQLLMSICFALREYLNECGGSQKQLVTADFDELLDLGRKVIETKIEKGKRLWQTACIGALNIGNISYRDTLRSIGGFFNRYDRFFFAHQIPCDIDYQLCHPVPDEYQGIEYINEYLERIVIENSILQRFDTLRIIRLLEGYCPDYQGLLINLCEPVIANAVGLTLIGGEPLLLEITDDDRALIAAFFEPLSKTKARIALMEAARRFCCMQGIDDLKVQKYMMRAAIDLYPRISAAMPTKNLDGIFTRFPA
jgi:hypothetical protein